MKVKLIVWLMIFCLLDSLCGKKRPVHRKLKKTTHRNSKMSSSLSASFKKMLANLPSQLQAPPNIQGQMPAQPEGPRELTSNPSVLPFNPSQLPQPAAAETPEGQPPLTILPPKFVTPSELKKLEKSPEMAANGFPFRKLRRHRKRHSHHRRKLNAFPFINPGPGFIDVGSNGYSPMSYSAMRPTVPQLAPFLPRDSPPPPVRLQLREPKLDAYKKDILTQSEKAIYDFETQKLKEELKKEMVDTTSFAYAIANSLKTQFTAIKQKVDEVVQRKESITDEVNQLKTKIEEKRKVAMNKEKDDQIKKEIELFKLQQSKMQQTSAKNAGVKKKTEEERRKIL